MRTVLLASLTAFEKMLRTELAGACPDADQQQLAAVSQALMALYFNLDALSPLQPPQQWRDSSREAADMLINLLEKGAS